MQNTKSAWSYLVESLTIVGLTFHACLLLKTWNLLPEIIPAHFNFAGQANDWGGRSDLLILFSLSIFFYLGLSWLNRHPQKFNYPWKITKENAERQYYLASNFLRVVKCQVIWLFAVISAMTVGVSFNLMSDLSPFLVPAILAVTGLTLIGYFVLASKSLENREGA